MTVIGVRGGRFFLGGGGGEGCASLGACGICGSLKETLFQALGDPQVRRNSLRTHWGFPPYSAGNSGH